jgi:glycosyltransferase involved in cell wall biosynthesis
MSALSISVIICAHNPRPGSLELALDGLKGQDIPAATWEFLLIDNASEQPLATRFDLRWKAEARHVREDKLGLTPARLRGIEEATGELLVFVDDDNVLDGDYLTHAKRIADGNPLLGAWSGQCRPVFEETPPEWTRAYWGNLALREFEADQWSNLPRLPETMPCGAGMCVRGEVARSYLHKNRDGSRSFQFDRKGDSLISGGDNDLAGCSCEMGLGVGIFAALKLEHHIPAVRMGVDYLARLAEGISFSSVLLDHAYGLPVHRRSPARRMADFLRRCRGDANARRVRAAAARGYDRAVRLVEVEMNALQTD